MRAVSNPDDGDYGRLAFGLPYDQHDGARAVLTAFDVSRFGLITPEVRIRNNQADFGLRKFHAQPRRRLFLFLQQVVEIIVGWIHPAGFNRIADFGRQVTQPIGATFQSTQSQELGILPSVGKNAPSNPRIFAG